MGEIDPKMEYVARVHLKTGEDTDPETGKKKTKKKKDEDRKELIKYCLYREKGDKTPQYIAIGWSKYCISENGYKEGNFQDYKTWATEGEKKKNRDEGKKKAGGLPPAINLFSEIKKDWLIWTRDLDGCYWICRAKSEAEYHPDRKRDIGAIIPVKAYKFGFEVPGQIRDAFSRPNGGTTERICNNDKGSGDKKRIIEYSKFIFNECSKEHPEDEEELYSVHVEESDDFLNNLSAFDLEELVISYLQIKKGYYVLSNSIANKSTTIKIECELRLREYREDSRQKAVVQVKAAKAKELRATDFKEFVKHGYDVYLYCPKYDDTGVDPEHIIRISKEELLEFVNENENILPDNIMKWRNLFGNKK